MVRSAWLSGHTAAKMCVLALKSRRKRVEALKKVWAKATTEGFKRSFCWPYAPRPKRKVFKVGIHQHGLQLQPS